MNNILRPIVPQEMDGGDMNFCDLSRFCFSWPLRFRHRSGATILCRSWQMRFLRQTSVGFSFMKLTKILPVPGLKLRSPALESLLTIQR